jgi:hypothetical protein
MVRTGSKSVESDRHKSVNAWIEAKYCTSSLLSPAVRCTTNYCTSSLLSPDVRCTSNYCTSRLLYSHGLAQVGMLCRIGVDIEEAALTARECATASGLSRWVCRSCGIRMYLGVDGEDTLVRVVLWTHYRLYRPCPESRRALVACDDLVLDPTDI